VDVVELAPGLWRWTARHPDWTSKQSGADGWEAEVASFYCEADGYLLLIDPIVPEEDGEQQRFWQALDRDVEKIGSPHVVLTCAWHARSSRDVVQRYPDTRLWVHAGGAAELPPGVVTTDPFRPGDPLPGGVSAIDAVVGDAEVLLWLPSQAALVCGDTLLGGGPAGIRVCPGSWLDGADPAAVRAELRICLEGLPVERVLVTHGEPVLARGREALDQALLEER
jgi:glyoxylase-like metal-dependent hydrolase (beta-lactamase superfamily II)